MWSRRSRTPWRRSRTGGSEPAALGRSAVSGARTVRAPRRPWPDRRTSPGVPVPGGLRAAVRGERFVQDRCRRGAGHCRHDLDQRNTRHSPSALRFPVPVVRDRAGRPSVHTRRGPVRPHQPLRPRGRPDPGAALARPAGHARGSAAGRDDRRRRLRHRLPGPAAAPRRTGGPCHRYRPGRRCPGGRPTQGPGRGRRRRLAPGHGRRAGGRPTAGPTHSPTPTASCPPSSPRPASTRSVRWRSSQPSPGPSPCTWPDAPAADCDGSRSARSTAAGVIPIISRIRWVRWA